ncbi:MAG: NAD-binding protein, partial [Lachnospiraceae bacterium]|nr:NAD-binding protein [Lachnospiraceae bacterium]
MQTLVIGCGTIGSTIAALLCREGHNVTVIDRSRDNVQNVTDRLDAMGYCADGTNLDDLIEAGVKDTDLAIAVTEGDEKNFIACMLAKKAGNCQTICRVATAESQRNARFLRDEMGLSMVINPKILSARAIQRLLKYPAAIDVETFANGRVELSRYRVRENSILTDCPLKDLSQRIRCSILVCIVERNGEVFIPGGDFTLRA